MPSDKPTRLRRAPPNAEVPDSLVSAGIAHDRPPAEVVGGEAVSTTPGTGRETCIATNFHDTADDAPKRESARVAEKVPFVITGK